MRLVRIDAIAPGGRPLELHPRLTVLRGVTSEMRRDLAAVVSAVAGAGEPERSTVVEVNGVRLALDAATLDKLRLDVEVDPVVVLGPDSPPGAGSPIGSVTGSGDRGVGRLRAELQEVAAERTQLVSRIDAARADLDPFASAAVDAATGRIEALERQRTALRAEWEQQRRRSEQDRARLVAALEALREGQALAASVDPASVLAARAALVAVLDSPLDQDVEAAELAERIDASLERLRELQARRSQVDIRVAEATQRLAEARAAAADAAAPPGTSPAEAELVRRLDEVRDQIFSLGDSRTRAGGRSKRRLQELQAEQAILLDELGFDTYSAYVMGIASARAEQQRIQRSAAAAEQVARVEAELAALKAGSPRPDEAERTEAELQTLLVRAQRHLGPAEALSVPLDVGGPGAADLIYRTVEALRRRRVAPPGAEDPAVRAAMSELRRCMATDPAPEVPPPGPPTPADDEGEGDPAPPGRPALLEPVDARGLLEQSDRWLAWHRDLREWADGAAVRREELERRLDALGDQPEAPDVDRWARVESELDALLGQLAEAQDRLHAHHRATEQVASLRDEELRLRDRERELLHELTEHQRDRAEATPSPESPPPFRGVPGGLPGAPGPGASVADQGRSAGEAAPAVADPEWSFVSRVARQRRVSFVGSLPMLVVADGLDADAGVWRRIVRLSDLVQMVVLVDDEAVVDRLHDLGAAMAVVEVGFARR